MSAYSASPPVTHSTTAPRMMKVMPGLCSAKPRRGAGDSAHRISGVGAGDVRHAQRRDGDNHSIITGPKNLPMPAVPCFCTKTGPQDHQRQRDHGAMKAGDITSRPPPPSTVMAGVMTPSP